DPDVRLCVFATPHTFQTNALDDNCPAWQALIKSLAVPEVQPCHQFRYRACTFLRNDGNRSWACCSAGMFAFLSAKCSPSQQQIYQPFFDHMLASLRLGDSHPGRLAVLRSEVLREFHRTYPKAECRIVDEQLQLGALHIFVENLLATIESNPRKRRVLIQQFVRTTNRVGRQAKQLGAEHWSTVQQRVYPMLRPAEFINAAFHSRPESSVPSARPSRQQQLTAIPWLANLVICYAIDSPDALRFVLNSDLERWNVDQPTLHHQALLNLQTIKGPQLSGVPAPDGSLLIAMPMDSPVPVNSAWLLHPDLFQCVQMSFRGPIWAAVPHRDTLLLFSSRHYDRVQVQTAIRQDYSTSHQPISDCLFRVNPDGIVLA
ncbi:MAG: hypothetical protein ACKO2P_02825, partial [Planctomycetota bacterium]